MKKTLYYNIRTGSEGGFLPMNPGKAGNEDNKHLVDTINEAATTLKQDYSDSLVEQNLSGHIDSIHKWLDSDDSFDSDFHNNLREQFIRISETSPFNGTKTSYTEPSLWDRAVNFVTGEDNEDKNTSFNLADYLYEAALTQKRMSAALLDPSGHGLGPRDIRKEEDGHPFRKCISNPFHFFSFEKKVIVGEVGEDARYGEEEGKGGTVTFLNIGQEFSLNSQITQGGQKGFEKNLTANAFLIALPLALGLLGLGGLGLGTDRT